MKKAVKVMFVLSLLALLLALGSAMASAQEGGAMQEVTCDSDVVIQADDWLSKLAEKFYGDPLAFPAIARATNAKATVDDSYTPINNVDVIEPGWKLCIPSTADAEAILGEAASAANVSLAGGPQPEITTLALGFGVDPPFAPHIVAIQKGWFQEAGFENVETKTFTAGALAGEALAAGEIQLWTPGNVPPISMRHNALPIVILGTNSIAYTEYLTVRSDAGVETPEDLYNIQIGLLEGSTASAVLANLSEHYGLDINRMQVVNLPPPEQLTSLINGDTQALIAWQPWPYLAKQQADVVYLNTGTVSGFPQDFGQRVQTSHTRSVWATSEDFLRNNPNAARAMMKVMLRAQAYVADPANRAEVIQMFSEFQEQPVEQNEAIWNNYVFDTTFDQSYVDDMQNYTDFLADAGRISNPIDPMAYTYTSLIQELRPEAVVLQGQWQP